MGVPQSCPVETESASANKLAPSAKIVMNDQSAKNRSVICLEVERRLVL